MSATRIALFATLLLVTTCVGFVGPASAEIHCQIERQHVVGPVYVNAIDPDTCYCEGDGILGPCI